jgi:hypothetical protein
MNENTLPMAHEEATKTNAVESYLLNELTEEQRCRFEEHYFECGECADAVMAGQTLIQGIRPLPAEPKGFWARLNNPVSVPSWRLWAMGSALAASLSLYAVRMPTLSPLPMAMANTAIVAKELEKSAVEENNYTLVTPSATVEVDPYGTDPFPFYRMTISREKKDIASQVLPAPAKQSGRKLSLQVTAKALGKGEFTVTLEGLGRADAASSKPLASYRFGIAPRD